MVGKNPQTIKHLAQIQFGFTLIELIVVMAFTSLIFGIGIVRYQDFNETQKMKNIGKGFRDYLIHSRAKAMAGFMPNNLASICGGLNGYQIQFRSRSVLPACSTTGGDCYIVGLSCSPSYIFFQTDTYNFPPSIYFYKSDLFLFGSLHGGELFGGNRQISLANSSSSTINSRTRWYSLCVNSGGDVKDCGLSTGTAEPVCTC